MVECTKDMLQSLKNALEGGESEVEIGEYLTELTADIISRTEFGTSYKKGKQIFYLLTQLQTRVAQSTRRLLLPGSRYVNLTFSFFTMRSLFFTIDWNMSIK